MDTTTLFVDNKNVKYTGTNFILKPIFLQAWSSLGPTVCSAKRFNLISTPSHQYTMTPTLPPYYRTMNITQHYQHTVIIIPPYHHTITSIYHDTNIPHYHHTIPYHEHHTTLHHNITPSPGCDQDHQQGEAQRIRSTKGRPEKKIYQLFQWILLPSLFLFVSGICMQFLPNYVRFHWAILRFLGYFWDIFLFLGYFCYFSLSIFLGDGFPKCIW